MSAACAACRRLKMKCVGFDNPPCDRCAKVGRDCIPQQYIRNRLRSHVSRDTVSVPGSTASSHGMHQPRDCIIDNSHDSNLPSIYSTSPLLSVLHHASPSDDTSDRSDSSRLKRQRVEAPYTEVSDRDMLELVLFACQKLLIYVPVLPQEDLQDPHRVVREKRDLALCICYVAARFLPGGNSIRERLFPSISSLVQERFPPFRGGDDAEITRLQAFAILYVYRPATTSPQTEALCHWRLKSVIEAYAMHLGCHRSVNELRKLIRDQIPNITTSNIYRRYIIWLWLFTMSQHISLVTGQPPSITEDATIRHAPDILSQLPNSPAITRILGEIEICLLWRKKEASIRDRGLGEWWCQIDALNHVSAEATMEDIDGALNSWQRKWEPIMNNKYTRGVLEFHFRFAKFCISTYSTRNLTVTELHLQDYQQQLIRRSVTAAVSFCSLLTDLGPLSKEESVRYLADFGFIMVSFCCLFILRACETYGSRIPDLLEHLHVVEEVAQMMVDVAVDKTHGPALYGRLLRSGLEKYGSLSEAEVGDNVDITSVGFNSPFQWDDGLVSMDPFWELSAFVVDDFEQAI